MQKEELKQKIKTIVAKYHKSSDKNDHFKALSEIAQLRGGKIKDGEVYVNNTTKMTFIDSLGNEFKITPNNVKNGKWSPYESVKVRDCQYHMEQLDKIAKSKGGRIKEGELYINAITKMIFIDKLGNEFKISPNSVKNGSWSPYESGNIYNNPEYHMKKLEEIATSKGGKIKDGQIYKNNSTKMIFIDKLKNEFKATPNSIKNGSWSPYETGSVTDPEYHMKKLEEIAASKDGKIKGGEIYKNNSTKMTFIDKLGNEFKMTPSAVKSGSWSPYESGNIYNNPEYHIKKLEEIASSKGGKIKNGEIYKNNSTKMTFIDKLGNEFKMTPRAVKSGKWSPYEVGRVTEPEYHMTQLKKIAKSKGWRIKDGEIYINNSTKMKFIDHLGNEFQAKPANIKSGNWSPYEKNRLEHICRQIIEQLYEKKFNSCWQTIKRKGKKNLQLDGYCSELKIAFEYQGIQHTTGWAKNKKSLTTIKKRDNEKKQICIEMGILLLEINYYKKINNSTDIIKQTIKDIKKSYKKNGLSIPYFISNFNIDRITIDFSKINGSKLMYEQLQEIAKSKGGKIKEGEQYINAITKLIFIDKLGNEFKMTPNNVKNGRWSPYEAGRVMNDPEYHMKKLEKIVKSKGGKIKKGEMYINNSKKMIFIDKLGNEFHMKPNSIKSGHWSPYESGTVKNPKYHMEQIEKIVNSKGCKIKKGEKYINAKTKMIFIDKLGNEFLATPDRIKNKNWNPPYKKLL